MSTQLSLFPHLLGFTVFKHKVSRQKKNGIGRKFGKGIGTLYSVSDLSKKTGIYPQVLRRMMQDCELPEPQTIVGLRLFYTESQFKKLVKSLS
jgi:hypothetical protein